MTENHDAPRLLECFVEDGADFRMRPAPHRRDWMDESPDRYAYRCLPLAIANTHGWELLNADVDAIANAVGFEYEWDVQAVLPAHEPRPAQLGTYGRLGWTTWMRRPEAGPSEGFVRMRFSPLPDDAVTIGT